MGCRDPFASVHPLVRADGVRPRLSDDGPRGRVRGRARRRPSRPESSLDADDRHLARPAKRPVAAARSAVGGAGLRGRLDQARHLAADRRACRSFIEEANAALQRIGAGLPPAVPSAISATAICTSTSRSRSARTRRPSWRAGDEVNALVHGYVARYGGSISAEHGIGRLKRDLLPQIQGSRRAGPHARDQGDARSAREY